MTNAPSGSPNPADDVAACFRMDPLELARRATAFDRLAVSTTLSAAVCSAGLLSSHPVWSLAGLTLLALVFVGSRTALAAISARYAQTVWTIQGSSLVRSDSRSRREYRLDRATRILTKRTTADAVREIRLDFDDGARTYVNGLQQFEGFAERLTSAADPSTASEFREPMDFDHPAFYIVLGVLSGSTLALLTRLALTAAEPAGTWIHATLAVYSLSLGAYWSRAKPVSGRYGEDAIVWDKLLPLVFIAVGLGAAAAAL